MRPGDEAFIYHTGGEKAIVGVARVATAAYPDPRAGGPRLVGVDLEPVRPLASPVTLAAVKADPRLAGFALVTGTAAVGDAGEPGAVADDPGNES